MTVTKSDLVDLLQDLRRAGWRRTFDNDAGPRDADGAPMHDCLAFHRWHRGTATITFPASFNYAYPPVSITYTLDEGDDFDHVEVGVHWVKARGLNALRRLAETVGVLGADLYPPTCARCNGGGMTGSVLGAEECGECGGLGVLMPARWSSPMGEAVPA